MKSKFHLHGLVLSREQTQLQMYMTFIIMRTPTTDTWQIRMKEYFKLSFLYNHIITFCDTNIESKRPNIILNL